MFLLSSGGGVPGVAWVLLCGLSVWFAPSVGICASILVFFGLFPVWLGGSGFYLFRCDWVWGCDVDLVVFVVGFRGFLFSRVGFWRCCGWRLLFLGLA